MSPIISPSDGGGGGSQPLVGDGSPVGVVTPTAAGDLYADRVGGVLWIAIGTADTDWIESGLVVTLTAADLTGYGVQDDAGHTWIFANHTGQVTLRPGAGQQVTIGNPTGNNITIPASGNVEHTGPVQFDDSVQFYEVVGFYGHAPAAQPTGVPVTAAGIHAALVSLGLITA